MLNINFMNLDRRFRFPHPLFLFFPAGQRSCAVNVADSTTVKTLQHKVEKKKIPKSNKWTVNISQIQKFVNYNGDNWKRVPLWRVIGFAMNEVIRKIACALFCRRTANKLFEVNSNTKFPLVVFFFNSL